MSTQLYFNSEITDEDLLDAQFSPNAIADGLRERIDFILVCPKEYTEDMLWPFLRNVDRSTIAGCLEYRKFNFRGSEKLVLIIWH